MESDSKVFLFEEVAEHNKKDNCWLIISEKVAAQQGSYLADCFNHMEDCERNPEGPIRFRGEGRHRFRPFRYKHLGQFAPLGREQAATELPGDWVSIGHNTP